jgi:hypothetical protein
MSPIVEMSIAESGGYVYCRVEGAITAEIARQISGEIQQFSDEAGILSRLIDVRSARNVMSVSNNYDLGYRDLEEQGVARAPKAAILVTVGDDSHDFAVVVIQNAGFNARKFTDEAAAAAWLEDCDA